MAKTAAKEEMSFTTMIVVLIAVIMLGAAAMGGGFNGIGSHRQPGFEVAAEWNGINGGVRISVYHDGVSIYSKIHKESHNIVPFTKRFSGSASDKVRVVVAPVRPKGFKMANVSNHVLFASIIWDSTPPIRRAVNEPNPTMQGILVSYPEGI